MISHDSTLVLSTLMAMGGKSDITVLSRQVEARLSCTIAHAVNYLIDSGRITQEISEAGCLKQLSVAAKFQSTKLTPPNKSNLNTASLATSSVANEHVAMSSVANEHVAMSSVAMSVTKLLKSTTDQRNFSAPYQAVVNGKVARLDPIIKFVEQMSPVDRPAFWKSFGEMDEASQENYRARIARLARRSRRD